MGMQITTNVAALNAQRNLNVTGLKMGKVLEKLSSGYRINRAADDAAGLAVSEGMRSQIRGMNVASRNAQDGVSMVQVADGALGNVGDMLQRVRDLAVQASNGTLNSGDRAVLDNEFQDLLSEIDRVADQTTFNGVKMFDGSTTSLDLQVGTETGETITITLEDATAAGLGLSGGSFDITTASNASAALDTIDSAIDTVSAFRGDLGGVQNRLDSVVRSISNTAENLAGAESRIRDVDIAIETADLTRNTILQQAALSVLAQANVQPQLALSLLG